MSANETEGEEEEGWIDVTPRPNRRKTPRNGDDNDRRSYQRYRPKPIRHFWNGFDVSGSEKWFLELENGNYVSSSDTSYPFLVKKFFPNDACHA